MSDVLDSIARLRRLVDALPALGDDGGWLAERLRSYLDARGDISLEQALSLSTTDAWTWWRLEQREAERAAAHDLVAACNGAKSAHDWLRRFAQGRGRFLNDERRFDDRRADAAHRYLRATGGRVPATAKTLERAVVNSGQILPE